MEFRYDIFISYAHHDNMTHGAWIAAFQDRLEQDFYGRYGMRLRVFFDQEAMGAGTVLSLRLQGALREARLFVPILTPAYLASTWCRREFLSFLDEAEAAGNLIIGNYSRIVPIRLMPWNHFQGDADSTEEVRRIRECLEGQELLYADFYRDPLPIPTNDPDFNQKIARFSANIYAIMQANAEPVPPVRTAPPRVVPDPVPAPVTRMPLSELKAQLQSFVAAGDLNAAFGLLSEHLRKEGRDYNTFLVIQGNYSSFKRDQVAGVLSSEHAGMRSAQLKSGLLGFVDMLNEGDLL